MSNPFTKRLSLVLMIALLTTPVAIMEEAVEPNPDVLQAEVQEFSDEVTSEMLDDSISVEENADLTLDGDATINVAMSEGEAKPEDLIRESETDNAERIGDNTADECPICETEAVIVESMTDSGLESQGEAKETPLLGAAEVVLPTENCSGDGLEGIVESDTESQAKSIVPQSMQDNSDASNTPEIQTMEASPTVISVLKKKVKTTVTAAPGTVYQIDLGGASGAKYKSSKKKVAQVDGNGNVTIKGAGKTKITFKVGKKKRALTLSVKDPTVPGSVALDMTGTNTVVKGSSVTLTPSVPEGTYSGFTWKTSNKKVATVKNGVVSFRRKGKAVITCIAKRGKKKAKVTYNVINQPATPPVSVPTTEVAEPFTLEKDYRWSSSYSSYGYAGLVVRNNCSVTKDCEASIQYYDESGQLVGVDTYTELAVAPGKQAFIMCMNDRPFVHINYALIARDSIYQEIQSFVNVQAQPLEGKAIISGTNIGSVPAEFVQYDCMFLDSQGQVVDHDWGYLVDADHEIKPGMTQSNEAHCYSAYDRVEVYYSGRYYPR